MFLWLWLIGWSAFVLPLAIASLRGWAPKRIQNRTSPWGVRVRGVAMLVMWIGGIVGPLLHWTSLDGDDTLFLATVAQVGLLMLAAGLIGGSQLGEWFHRRAMRARAADDADHSAGRPQ
ncbi:hypothetical protein [Streptomyces sp. WM6386]|uniref:hypothetical protein n=1 Tax=Streptomyces sp. WM6386 TaxID=1415558 RepID=UPI000AB1CC79|nr:hypothetical protein [Streptomyces sp. WM6386]